MKYRILIADDANFMRMMLKNILTENGYAVVGEATNGREAVEKYFSCRPDLVLLDITMPEIDGLHALKEIKQMDPTAKIVMCSAMGQESIVVECIKSGAVDFVVKPFKADRILKTLNSILK